jgi:hypothetical protein
MPATLGKPTDTLNAIMEFDHVVQVHPDGTVTDGPTGVYAPTLSDEELDSPHWQFFSAGYSRQDSYGGPIMHNSESIGGNLARDILTEPGIYAAIVAYWTPDVESGENPNEDVTEGWAVVRYEPVTA